MKTARLLLLFAFLANNTFAQCYKNIVSYSRNYIALQTDGTLWSKGNNFYGNLGFANNNDITNFMQIGSDTDWTDKLSLSSTNGFCIKIDGSLWVWGNNSSSGSSGLGTFDISTIPFAPQQIGTDNNWVEIASNFTYTLAVKADGTLWAWGINDRGQLGTGNADTYKTHTPVQIGTDTNWKKVYSGELGWASYAIKTDGTLWAWGANGTNIGYLNADQNDAYRIPHQIGTDTWQTVAVGGSFGKMTMAIKTDGTLWGWGASDNDSYFFGNGVDIFSSITPLQIGSDSNWKDVELSQNTTLALKTDGTRWGWGRNGTGYRLGMGTGMTNTMTVPTQCDTDTDWKHLSIDLYSGYGDGIKVNNSLYHWGNDNLNIIHPSPELFSDIGCTLGAEDFDYGTFIIYPNPVKDFLRLSFSINTHEAKEIVITNSLGQIVLSKNVANTSSEYYFDLRDFADGIYCIAIKSGINQYTRKIIKI